MAIESSVERRLQKLREQQAAITDKIKQVEQEKAKALRKVRLKRQSLIGAVVMELVEKGEKVTFSSESDLLTLMDQVLVKKTERQAFGLSMEVSSSEVDRVEEKSVKMKSEDKDVDAESSSVAEPGKGKKTSTPRSRKRLTTSGTQQEMMEEFNV